MAKDIKEQSAKALKRKIKAASIVLVACGSVVVVSIVISFLYGKSPSVLASSAGFLGLFVATMMWTGMKKAKDEMAS